MDTAKPVNQTYYNHINTSTNPDGGHMSNYIRQIKVKVATEPLEVEKPLRESSSEMD